MKTSAAMFLAHVVAGKNINIVALTKKIERSSLLILFRVYLYFFSAKSKMSSELEIQIESKVVLNCFY